MKIFLKLFNFSESVLLKTIRVLSHIGHRTLASSAHIDTIIQSGAIQKLIEIVASEDQIMAKNAVSALFYICGDRTRIRNRLVKEGIIMKLLVLIQKPNLTTATIANIICIFHNIVKLPGLTWNEELQSVTYAILTLMNASLEIFARSCIAFTSIIRQEIIPSRVLNKIVTCVLVYLKNRNSNANAIIKAAPCLLKAAPFLSHKVPLLKKVLKALTGLQWFELDEASTQTLPGYGLKEILENFIDDMEDEVHYACVTLMEIFYAEEVARKNIIHNYVNFIYLFL